LLGLIDLTGVLVTGDALHCQGETARLIKDRGGDWLFTLKANRPVQHAEVRAWFADRAIKPDGEHTTTDADNGRIESAAMPSALTSAGCCRIGAIRMRRRCRVSPHSAWWKQP